MSDLKKLTSGLNLCLTKKDKPRTCSIAYSRSGNSYLAGYLESDTHLLFVPSEQAALMLAVQNSDYQIFKLVTLVEENKPGELVSPLVLKILIDFARRTGLKLAYSIIDNNGHEIFNTENVNGAMDIYRPAFNPLSKIKNATISQNKNKFLKASKLEQLRTQAMSGIFKNFPTYDSASGYGSAVLASNNYIYCSGQYSSFEHRTNIHSEMGAVIAALMDGQTQLKDIALVSTKYTDTPCQMCGACRQFLAEISARFNLDLTIHLFAYKSDIYETYKLNEYLPKSWSSKKW